MTIRFVIQHIAFASGEAPHMGGLYIKAFDPDAADGVGAATLTDDIDDALSFPTPGDCHAFWFQQSKVKPIRDDGRPNRPLTASTVAFIPVEVTVQ